MKTDKVQCAEQYLNGLRQCIDMIQLDQIEKILGYLEDAYQANKQVFIIGNGGSAATASHMACDLGKNIYTNQNDEVRRLRVHALTDNVAWITALANDLGHEYIFSEQLKTLMQKDDLLIVISGSGNSPNVVEGVKTAKRIEANAVGLLGFDGGKVVNLLDAYVLIQSRDYCHVEDLQMALGHLITKFFKKNFDKLALT